MENKNINSTEIDRIWSNTTIVVELLNGDYIETYDMDFNLKDTSEEEKKLTHFKEYSGVKRHKLFASIPDKENGLPYPVAYVDFVDEKVVVTTCGNELGCCNDEYKLDEVELYVRTDDGFIEI